MPTVHNPAAFAAGFDNRLSWTSDDLYKWSLTMADACINANEALTDEVFGITPTGETPEAAKRRAFDSQFWRRKGALRLKRALSEYAQHQKAVGKNAGCRYVSPSNRMWYVDSVKRQAHWAKTHVILDQATRQKQRPLASVMNTPDKLWAKTFAFINGLQTIATEDHGYKWFMATITLPGCYHANPSNGVNTWNGTSVKKGFDDLMEGVNRMGARLAKEGIRKIGIGSEEPQQDETPHLHEGLFYKDDAALWKYFEEYARQFPGPLKVISGSKHKVVTVYRTLASVLARKGEPGKCDSPGRVTITLGDPAPDRRKVTAFAAYMSKYIAKNVGKALADENHKLAGVESVLAHRNAQGIRGWRFYGLPVGALSGWDELRRVNEESHPIRHALMKELADAAKGCDAARFIRALGGLVPDSKPAQFVGLRLLTEAHTTKYGEVGRRTIGVRLVQFTRERLKVPTGKVGKRGQPLERTRTFIREQQLDAVLSRYERWELMSESAAEGLHGFTTAENRAVGVTHNCPRGAPGHEAQRTAIEASPHADVFVESAAGSGKTYVLTNRVKFLREHGVPARSIMVCTHTREAVDELRERLGAMRIGGVTVGTMHSISYEMLGGKVTDFDAMIEKATALGDKRFHVLVDEAQDLSASQIAWAKAHAATLFVVGDPNQSIYTFRGSMPNSMAELWRYIESQQGTLDMFGATARISIQENRRSTSQIVAFGNALCDAKAYATRNGAPIQVDCMPRRSEELEAVASVAAGALVLVRTNRERIEVKAALANAGITPRAVMTIHASKGKESDRVVLACGTLKGRLSSDSEERRLLYVAVTRARNELHITSTGRLPEAMQAAILQLEPRP